DPESRLLFVLFPVKQTSKFHPPVTAAYPPSSWSAPPRSFTHLEKYARRFRFTGEQMRSNDLEK
ncbi:MAG TPA: hypothetical protein VGH27_13690, partial [Streptosporangiaceae bacterium]